MALSIKNEEVERLVRDLARETGRGVTETIRFALQEEYDRLRRSRRGGSLYDDIGDIGRRCGALPDLDTRTPDEILGYNDQGVL